MDQHLLGQEPEQLLGYKQQLAFLCAPPAYLANGRIRRIQGKWLPNSPKLGWKLAAERGLQPFTGPRGNELGANSVECAGIGQRLPIPVLIARMKSATTSMIPAPVIRWIWATPACCRMVTDSLALLGQRNAGRRAFRFDSGDYPCPPCACFDEPPTAFLGRLPAGFLLLQPGQADSRRPWRLRSRPAIQCQGRFPPGWMEWNDGFRDPQCQILLDGQGGPIGRAAPAGLYPASGDFSIKRGRNPSLQFNLSTAPRTALPLRDVVSL